MSIWVVTYYDGFEFSGVFIAAFLTEIEAIDYIAELMKNRQASFDGWDYEEYVVGTKAANE